MSKVLARGIDVSTHQGKIDWAKVKASGMVGFVFIRVGYRGYGKSGKINEDIQFAANIKGASEQGIPIGLYFYSTALNEAEAIEEAKFVLSKIGNYNIVLPIVYDFEGWTNSEYRTYGISKEQRTANCKAFNKVIYDAGYNTLLYGSKAYVRTKFDIDDIKDYIWLAAYPNPSKVDPENPPSIGKYDSRVAIWQYSSKGRIDGINGNVDLNYMYINVIGKDNTTDNPYQMPTRTLYLGNTKMTEEDIMWLQLELIKDGYDIEINGVFDKVLNAVLRDYQHNHNLEVDGKCGPLTKNDMIAR